MHPILKTAFSQYGIREIEGFRDNPEVLKYFDEIGYSGSKLKDETAWCSAFVNWCCKVSGYPYTGKLYAMSWLDWGDPVADLDDAQIGDVVVFWRGRNPGQMIPGTNIPTGHVGFYIRHDDQFVWVLGGNQSNRVMVLEYPRAKLVGIRRAKEVAQ